MSDCESSNSPPEVIQSCAWLSRYDEACSIIVCVLMQIRQKLSFYWPQNKGCLPGFSNNGDSIYFLLPSYESWPRVPAYDWQVVNTLCVAATKIHKN